MAPGTRWALAPLLALALAAVGPDGAAGQERIRDFSVEIALGGDTDLVVQEDILYDFGGEQRHGIFRDLPVRYPRPGADWTAAVTVLEVSDGQGARLRHRAWRIGPDLRIRIGDPDATVTGQHRYRIRYRVDHALLYFEEHDELYWNVTGNGWQVPIDAARARVVLPGGGSARAVGALCFTGPAGARLSACTAQEAASPLEYATTQRLAPGEGLTIVAALPKGLLREPTQAELWEARLGDWLSPWLLAPLVACLGMGWLWRRFGRDVGGRDAIPVRYEPPEGLTPAEMGTLLDERADLHDVTATLLDLAVRGYLRIVEQKTRKYLFLSRTDFALDKLRDADAALKGHERALLAALFDGRDRVTLSQLTNSFYADLPRISGALEKEVCGRGRLFSATPRRVRAFWTAVAAAIVVASIGAVGSLLLLPQEAAPLAASAIFFYGFGRAMPRRTVRGRRAYEEILGFREFVSRVDADRLRRLDFLDATHFERILPYALVLGVADHWADVFADVYKEPPRWYVGAEGGVRFRSSDFVSDVGRSLRSVGSAMSSRPSSVSAGSGGSGFGGGGSSGGGFGGGGGGSW